MVDFSEEAGKKFFRLGKVEKALLVDLHKVFGGDIRLASYETGVPRQTIRKVWLDAGLSASLTALQDMEEHRMIVDLYDTYGGNATKAADDLGRGPGYIIRHWREEGLEILDQGYPYDGPRG